MSGWREIFVMKNEFINLFLEKLDSNDQTKQYKLDEILEQTQANVVIVLGAPGSGKSSILKNYQENHQKIADIYNVKNFIELEKTTTKSILFLDGLDEYRNTSNDKVFVIEKLGAKISTLDTTKVIISCREMDWYGEDDKNALKDEINTEVEIYRILPLEYSQQLELAIKIQIHDPEVFVESLDDKGLISNPQMFVMMADLYIQNPELKIMGKSELYKEYIKYSKENNSRYMRNNLNMLSEEEIFNYAGYLASFYIFSNIDTFNERILESVANIDFPLNKLNAVLNSKLFIEQKFSHRTIAEFLAGNYLANNLLDTSIEIDVKRVKSLFTDSDKIPTELRGTYAWLCSISKNHELIAVDPYYQAIHGDNALFDIEQKREIILEVKKYAQKSPYFYKFNHHIDLQGFYDARLEKFFVQELKEAVELKNHYLYFICSVLEGTIELGSDIREAIKVCILDNAIPDHYRGNLILILNNEDNFLVEVINKIKNNKLQDDSDRLKEAILSKLYPTVIDTEDVGQYLRLYHRNATMSHCFFLNETPYSEQRELVDKIHRFSLIDENGEKQLVINTSIKHFVDKYFLDTVLQFENGLDAEAIYEILKDFKSRYYNEYESIDFDRFSWRLKEGEYDEKIQKLADELFRLYVQDELKHEKERYDFFEFNYIFTLKYPNNCYATLLSCMNQNLDYKANELLFVSAIAYAPRDEEKKIIPISELQKIANKFDLNDIIKAHINPNKLEWEIKAEKRMEEQRKKTQEELEANEEYFAKKSDDEIQKSFNDLYWFSKIVYFEKEKKELNFITQKTFERLKEILGTAMYSELIEPELLTIQELAKQKGNNRNIDTMYYAALALNNDLDVGDQIKSDVILKYFYINSLLSSNIGNNNANFHEKVDTSFSLNTLKAYIALLISTHANELENIVMNYIHNETDIQRLQDIAVYHGYYNKSFKDGFIDIFMKTYNFDISKENLTQLKSFADESNKNTIEALECFIGEECEKFSMAMAIAMYELFSHKSFRIFNPYPNLKRASVISKMMGAFNTEESIEHVNGVQSQKNMCANFLTTQVLKVLEIEEYEELLQEHENDIWTNQIKHAFDEKKQAKMDSQGYGHYPIEYIKDFILKQSIISAKDFFEDVCLKLKKLSTKIEGNRGNEKKRFYNATVPKDENECRDIIRIDLEHLYQAEWSLTKEQHEADNRVDLNIKYKNNDRYEIQIECKKDKNRNLLSGIQEQLINQYFSSEVQYGIYLVFYFGDYKKAPEELLTELKSKIPTNHENKIEIILIDLRK